MQRCIFSDLGITAENFTTLIQHAQLPSEDRDMITNLQHLGCNVVVDVRIDDFDFSFSNCLKESKNHLENL